MNSPSENASFWSSFARYSGPRNTSSHYRFIVSVILDGGAWTSFSAIRLVIVHRNVPPFTNTVVKDYLVSGTGPIGPRALLRAVWSQRRDAIALAKVSNSTSDGTLPICSAIFEIVDIDYPEHYWVSFTLKQLTNLHPPQDDEFRIVYDRLHLCHAASRSAIVFLETSRRSFQTPGEFASPNQRIPTFTLRILPITEKLRPSRHLPPEVLRHIVIEALDRNEWRSHLLGYGMVCKSWSHVLDLFYSPSSRYRDLATIISVAQSLKHHPERAKQIVSLSNRHYVDTHPKFWTHISEDDHMHSCRALLDVLDLAISVREVEIWPVHESLVTRLVHGMSQLRNVQNCRVWGPLPSQHSTQLQRKRAVSIEDIQKFIANWLRLAKLEISYCESVETNPSNQVPATEDLPLPLENLTCLNMRHCYLSARQLLRFVQCPQPRLEELRLQSVRTIRNSDLLQLLRLVASTLIALYLDGLEIEKSTPDENYALDVAIPYMTALESLKTSGDVLSSFAIAGKPHVQGPLTYKSSIARPKCPSIRIEFAPALNCRDFLSALQVTSWKHIYVQGGNLQRGGKEFAEEAKSIASARGITLEFGSELQYE